MDCGNNYRRVAGGSCLLARVPKSGPASNSEHRCCRAGCDAAGESRG